LDSTDVDWHQHPNGGGWIHKTATVSELAYLGPNDTVFGYAYTGVDRPVLKIRSRESNNMTKTPSQNPVGSFLRGRRFVGDITASPKTPPQNASERQTIIDTAMQYSNEWQVRPGDDVCQNAIALVYGMLLVASDVSQRMVN
jgi:hypothetical protein